jgi:hypothetical protein
MTANGIPDIRTQFVRGVRLGENRLTEGSGGVTAFRRFFDHEDEFVHG